MLFVNWNKVSNYIKIQSEQNPNITTKNLAHRSYTSPTPNVQQKKTEETNQKELIKVGICKSCLLNNLCYKNKHFLNEDIE